MTYMTSNQLIYEVLKDEIITASQVYTMGITVILVPVTT